MSWKASIDVLDSSLGSVFEDVTTLQESSLPVRVCEKINYRGRWTTECGNFLGPASSLKNNAATEVWVYKL